MSFLEKARELQKPKDGESAPMWALRHSNALDFMAECWPEILAMVEASRLATCEWERAQEIAKAEGYEWNQADADEGICEALEALDRKADKT